MPETTWRNRIVREAVVDPADLTPNPSNWRTHPARQASALTQVLDDVGWVQRVIVNERTGRLVDGHLRVAQAEARGEQVPVVYVDLSEEEERLVLATLDPLTGLADRDDAILSELLAELREEGRNLADYGWDDNELLRLLGAPAGLTDENAAPEPSAPERVEPGSLWALGDHRLLCGDATNPDDVARLLDGAKPHLMVTDPPYGVSYDPTWRKGAARTGKVPNDNNPSWPEAYRLFPGDVAYVWHSGLHSSIFATDLDAAGFERRAQIVWAKPALVMGRGHYHWSHEPCWYAVRKGGKAAWCGDRKQSTIWNVAQVHPRYGEDDEGTTHGTQKPVEVMRRPIVNHRGDVYDPFVGSGTTIIAAEQVGRRCFAIDIDPVYAEMAMKRWEAYTGREGERVASPR